MPINPWKSSSIRNALQGESFIDAKRIHIHSLEEASLFLQSYGYDLDDAQDAAELKELKAKSIELIEDELLLEGESIPQSILEDQDPRQLLLIASNPRKRELALWCGSILRVLHTLVHSYSYLNDKYHTDIREQIFSRFNAHIIKRNEHFQMGDIRLVNFELRPEKTQRSVAMKLMHKSENVAADIFDWIGLRIITEFRADVLEVLAYLRNHHIIAYANLKPYRTRNTLLNLDWIKQSLQEGISVESLKQLMQNEPYPTEKESKSDNPFSSTSYHSVQLTCRQRIKIRNDNQKSFAFFFPFELQIMDIESYEKSRQGLASHSEYKKRQRASVRKRILPFLK